MKNNTTNRSTRFDTKGFLRVCNYHLVLKDQIQYKVGDLTWNSKHLHERDNTGEFLLQSGEVLQQKYKILVQFYFSKIELNNLLITLELILST